MKLLLVFTLALGLVAAAPQPRSLIDDLLDFVKLIPVDKIKAIADDHLANDSEFCTVVKYLQSDAWAKLVDEVKNKKEVKDFEKYLTDAGLPVDVIVEVIHDLIAAAQCTLSNISPRSLRTFLDEVEAALPVADMEALLEDKMANSPDFQKLYAKISSKDAKKLVEDVRALPEVQRIASRLKEMGVKVDEALALIYEFLGWGKP